MIKRNRVVITGIGILAPNGIGLEAFWESLLAGSEWRVTHSSPMPRQ